ncbi:ATP-binding protein [Streptomyces sp. NPDC006458]|uniref:ATP-binding protein n=1 Tax=Streptomyces sp. NPDC006458 TaxID=3154302 RepID=UPI0033B1307E
MTVLTLAPPSQARPETHTAFAHAACSAATSNACVPALRHFVSHFVQRLGLSEDLRDAACLVASELITNAVLHSGSNSVTVLVGMEGHGLIISVRDRGSWRMRTDPRHSPADDDVVCGRGLDLVRTLTDHLSVSTGSTGTVVKAFLTIDPLVPLAILSGSDA